MLLDRSVARFPECDDLEAESAGEVNLHFHPEVEGSTAVLLHHMLHNDFDTLFRFFERHSRYSDWEAVVQSKPNRRGDEEPNTARLRLLKRSFDAAPFRLALIFRYSCVIRRGFRDPSAGLYALALPFYTWQICLSRKESALLERRASIG